MDKTLEQAQHPFVEESGDRTALFDDTNQSVTIQSDIVEMPSYPEQTRNFESGQQTQAEEQSDTAAVDPISEEHSQPAIMAVP